MKGAVLRTRDEKGSVLLLLGEPGIGKTRLATELKNYARSIGTQVLSGRCPALFEAGGVPPYSLWVEVIKDYLDTCTPETLLKTVGPYPQEVSRLVPEVWHKLERAKGAKQLGITGWMKGPGHALGLQTTSVGPENERLRLLEAVSKFIENISNEGSCMIVLDDLQWADQSSLILFHYLSQGVSKTNLVLIGIYRDTEIDEKHPFRPVIAEFERERLSKSLRLDRLSFDESMEMIRGLLGEEDVPAAFGRAVYEKTGGNPYFIEEVLRSLIETGGIRREGKGWKFDDVHKIRLPDNVRELIRRRLGRLEGDHMQALVAASIVGKEFSFDTISGVAGIQEDKLLAIMDDILRTGLVEEQVVRGQDVYVFSDILVRNVVYEGISKIRRKKLHGTVALLMEKLYAGDMEDHLGELAYHFLKSGDQARALNYFMKAGERAMRVYAHSEAFSYLSTALQLLEERSGSARERAGLQETLGDILVYEGEHREALEHWAKALELWGNLEERRRQARLHTRRAHVLWDIVGDKDGASKEHAEALAILEKEPESSELAKLYHDISWMLWRFGDTPKSKEFTQRAFSLGQKLGDNEVIADSYGMIGGFERDAGNFRKYIETYETMLKVALESNNVQTALIGYDALSNIYWFFDFNPEKADEYLRKGLEFSKKVGHIPFMAFLTARGAFYEIDKGECRKAINTLEESLTLQRKIGNPLGVSNSLSGIVLASLRLGDLDRCQRRLDEELGVSKISPEFQLSAYANCDLAMLHLERDEYAQAKTLLEESLSGFRKAKFIGEYDVHPLLVQAYLATGEYEKASEMIALFYDHVINTGWRRNLPVALRLKAMLCHARGEPNEAIRLFTESLQMLESMGARKWLPYELARTLYEMGLTYSEGGLQDREKARSCLNDALQTFERIEAKRWIEKTRARRSLLEAQEQVKPASPSPSVPQLD